MCFWFKKAWYGLFGVTDMYRCDAGIAGRGLHESTRSEGRSELPVDCGARNTLCAASDTKSEGGPFGMPLVGDDKPRIAAARAAAPGEESLLLLPEAYGCPALRMRSRKAPGSTLEPLGERILLGDG